MKKRFLSVIAVLSLVLMTALSGCSNSMAEKNEEKKPEYILNLGDAMAEDHPHSRAFYWFADRVTELTDGRVQVNVFVNSTLGNQPDLIEGLTLRTVHIAKTMTTGLSVYAPQIQIFDLPYIFKDREHLFRVIDGEIGQYYAKDLLAQHDMVGIAYFYAGTRSIYSDKKITKLEDVKGRKLRVPDSPIFISFCESLGASGTPMPMGDIYTGIQTGVIDGAENSPTAYYYQKHYEAAPQFNLTEHSITPDIVLMSKSYLESLPQDIQDAILQAGQELQQYERELWISEEKDILEDLKEDKVSFNKVDREQFEQASKKTIEKYSSIVGQDMIDKIKALEEE